MPERSHRSCTANLLPAAYGVTVMVPVIDGWISQW